MEYRQITSTDVDAYKAIRLRALKEDPAAFGSTFARESAFPQSTWLERCRDMELAKVGCGWMAMDGDKPVGLIGVRDFGDPDEVLIVSMWVAPEARRQGVATRLLDLAISWAKARPKTHVVALEVGDTNAVAIAAYECYGFVDTGERALMPERDGAIERMYRLAL